MSADVLYTATATAHGGRLGHAETSDGAVSVQMEPPGELGGPGTPGTTNPEQLFATGYAACFLSALSLHAGMREIDASAATVTADVHLTREGRAFALAVDLHVRMPGVEPEVARKLVDRAEATCPYTNATRGNVPTTVTLQDA